MAYQARRRNVQALWPSQKEQQNGMTRSVVPFKIGMQRLSTNIE